jgi:hypothetical protein
MASWRVSTVKVWLSLYIDWPKQSRGALLWRTNQRTLRYTSIVPRFGSRKDERWDEWLNEYIFGIFSCIGKICYCSVFLMKDDPHKAQWLRRRAVRCAWMDDPSQGLLLEVKSYWDKAHEKRHSEKTSIWHTGELIQYVLSARYIDVIK